MQPTERAASPAHRGASSPVVAMVIGQLELGGGAEGQIAELAMGLPGHGFTPVLISLRAGAGDGRGHDNYWARYLRDRGLRVHEIARSGNLDLRRVVHLARILRREAPAIVHSQMFPANAYARTAAVVACRRSVLLTSELNGRLAETWTHRFVDACLEPFTDGIIANADFIRRMLVERGTRAPVWVVANGIDASRYDPGRRAAARAALGIRDGRPVVGIVARMSAEKDYPFFLDVVRETRRAVPALKAVAFGDGPLRPLVEDLVHRHGLDDVVTLQGRVDDLASRLPALDVFLLTSRWEGLSNAIMEAQACGIPAVVTAVGGNGEVVSDGRTGHVVASGELAAFVSRVTSLLTDDDRRLRMGAEARRRMETEFSMARMVRATADVYRHCLDRRKPA